MQNWAAKTLFHKLPCVTAFRTVPCFWNVVTAGYFEEHLATVRARR